jgi:hypothetical protein
VNVAVTVSALLTVVWQVVEVPEHPLPDQPANEDPEAGVAVNVTWVPGATLAPQVPGQLIPPPDTDPAPEPATETVNDTRGSCRR